MPVPMRIRPNTDITTKVRIKVARSESMLSTPTLAKIAVSAANTADSKAHSIQELLKLTGLSRSVARPASNCGAVRQFWRMLLSWHLQTQQVLVSGSQEIGCLKNRSLKPSGSKLRVTCQVQI